MSAGSNKSIGFEKDIWQGWPAKAQALPGQCSLVSICIQLQMLRMTKHCKTPAEGLPVPPLKDRLYQQSFHSRPFHPQTARDCVPSFDLSLPIW